MDGHTIPVFEVAIPLYDETLSIAGGVVAFWDLSKEEELNKVKEMVTSLIAHELSKPLTRLSTKLQLFRELPHYLEGEAREESLKTLQELTEKMSEVVTQTMHITQLESKQVAPDSEELDVAKLIEDSVARFKSLGTHQWECKLPRKPLYALADPKRTEIILKNLLDNAVKFSPPGTRITVEAGEIGDEIFISVQDQGKGIPAYYHNKVFDKFYRIESSESQKVDGLGLGLYLCKLLTEVQGGHIWVESEPGKGARFTFTLPKVGRIGADSSFTEVKR